MPCVQEGRCSIHKVCTRHYGGRSGSRNLQWPGTVAALPATCDCQWGPAQHGERGSTALGMLSTGAISGTVVEFLFIAGPYARWGGPSMWPTWHCKDYLEWWWKPAASCDWGQEDILWHLSLRGQRGGTRQSSGNCVHEEGKENSMSDSGCFHVWWNCGLKFCRCVTQVWETEAHWKHRNNQLSNIWDIADQSEFFSK